MKKIIIGLAVILLAVSGCSYDYDQKPLENNGNYRYNSMSVINSNDIKNSEEIISGN